MIVTDANSQAVPANISFYNPSIGSTTQTIAPFGGTGDDSHTFINVINLVNKAGGVIVIVNAGRYKILEVDLRFNEHIAFNSGMTLLPFNLSTSHNNSLFIDSANTGINNFSQSGVGGNFELDRSAYKTSLRLRCIKKTNRAFSIAISLSNSFGSLT